MTQRKFNILDSKFWETLRDVIQAMERHHLPYALVGGAAIQVWIAALLTEQGKQRIEQNTELPLRLRSTKDVDLSARCESHEIMETLNELAATSGHGAYVLSSRACRIGELYVNLTIDSSDVTGFKEHYDQIIDSANSIMLRHGQERLNIRVESIEYLVFTKLTRKGNQSKDLVDVDTLCVCLSEAGQQIQLYKMLTLLTEVPRAQDLLHSFQERYPEVFSS